MNTTLSPKDSRTAQRRKLFFSILAASLAIHAGAALVAGAWIVARHFAAPAPKPEPLLKALAPPPPPIPEREQRLQAAALEGGAAKPTASNRLQSTRSAPLALPALPKLPNAPVLPLSAADFSSNILFTAGVTDAEGIGSSSGKGGNGAGSGPGVSFLGVQTNARRIVLMYDVSKTVASAAAKAGVPMERVRSETERLIAELSVNTRFTLVEFARNYAFFRPELLSSTTANRAAATQWLAKHFAITGTLPSGIPGLVSGSPGFLVALEAVFKLLPDAVFILSDGNMQRGTGTASTIPLSEIEKTLTELQAQLPQKTKIYFIGVGTSAETEHGLRRIMASTGGSFSPLKP